MDNARNTIIVLLIYMAFKPRGLYSPYCSNCMLYVRYKTGCATLKNEVIVSVAALMFVHLCFCVCSSLQAHIHTHSTLAQVRPSSMLCPLQTLNRLPMLPHLMTLTSLTKISHPSKQACGK
jgi:hypothetical protein